jgi:hypothetical protein
MQICHVVPPAYLDLSIKHSDILFIGTHFPQAAIDKARASTKLLLTDLQDVADEALAARVTQLAKDGFHLAVCKGEWQNPEKTIALHKECMKGLPEEKDIQLRLICVPQGATAPDWQSCLMEMAGALQDKMGSIGFPADVMTAAGSYYTGDEKNVSPNRPLAIKRLAKRQMAMNQTSGILLGSGNSAAQEMMDMQLQNALVDKVATPLALGAALSGIDLRKLGMEHDAVIQTDFDDSTPFDQKVADLADLNMVFLNEYAHGV